MNILAIDPGTTQSAYLHYDSEKPEIISFKKCKNEELVLFLKDRGHLFDYFVIEGIVSYGTAVGQTTIQTCYFIGQLHQLISTLPGIKKNQIYVVSRQEIKMQHCKQVRKVNDSTIRQALIDKYGEPGVMKNKGFTYGLAGDTWSAFAIATFFAESMKENTKITNLI